MKMFRIILKSKTAFFRNDVTSTSYQESFNCPPISTIYGIVASAYGGYRYDFKFGFTFDFLVKSLVSELVIQKTNSFKDKLYKKYLFDDKFDRKDILVGCTVTLPIKREILYNCTLTLYVDKEDIAEAFKKPYYPILLGRSEDLALVKEVKEINLLRIQNCKSNIMFGKTIIPFELTGLMPGRISKMNIKISDSIPRKVKKVGIFSIIDNFWPIQYINGFKDNVRVDPETGIGVFIYDKL